MLQTLKWWECVLLCSFIIIYFIIYYLFFFYVQVQLFLSIDKKKRGGGNKNLVKPVTKLLHLQQQSLTVLIEWAHIVPSGVSHSGPQHVGQIGLHLWLASIVSGPGHWRISHRSESHCSHINVRCGSKDFRRKAYKVNVT